jgi:diacylglycerol O-acyltransferase
VALCATAVREWLLDRGELPEDPLVSMVPVSVRKEGEEYGNRIGAMIVPIPTNEPDTRKRLMRTHELLRSAKERHAAVPAALLTDATAFIPPAVAALAARTTMQIMGRTRPPLNLVISNVPGPRDPLYCAGAKLQASFPVSVVIDGVGLNITVMSYLDRMDFGIIADRDQVDDVWSLMDGVREALADFEETILGKAPPALSSSGEPSSPDTAPSAAPAS